MKDDDLIAPSFWFMFLLWLETLEEDMISSYAVGVLVFPRAEGPFSTFPIRSGITTTQCDILLKQRLWWIQLHQRAFSSCSQI